jgi:hypothetical protein
MLPQPRRSGQPCDEGAPIHTKVSNDLSQPQHMQLVDGLALVLALDDPDNIKTDLMRPHEDVDVMSRPHTLHGVIGGCVEPDSPKTTPRPPPDIPATCSPNSAGPAR